MSARQPVSSLVAALVVAAPGVALANGNVAHEWISVRAAALTPPGGSLDDLVNDAALKQQLYTGTMFPDWGYTPGATSEERNAGEASHWEYVQEAYRLWIVENYEQPWSDEARMHLAFYMGMTSHGMADQTCDSMFFERSEFYENKSHDSFDQESDVMWAATAGPGEVPSLWLPEDQLLSIFDDVVAETIDASSMEQKVTLVGTAIGLVNTIAMNPDQVAEAEAEYPWAAEHDDDPEVPGNPPGEAEAVRRYWRSNWALIHGQPLPRPVLWTFPEDGGAEHEVMSGSIESWVTVVFARGIDQEFLDDGKFHLEDSTGLEVPVEVNLFYGNSSHVVHLKPQQDLVDDEVYVVTVDAGVRTIHGEQLEGWDFTFSTGTQGPTALHDDGFWDEPDDYGEGGTGDETGGETGDAGVTDDESGGCSVASSGPRGSGMAFMLLALLGFRSRRRAL